MIQKNNASIFISTVIFISLATGLSLFAMLYAQQSTYFQSNDYNATRNKSAFLKDIFKKITNQDYINKGILHCFSQNKLLCVKDNSSFSNIDHLQDITGFTLVDKNSFPQVDFNKIFDNTNSCDLINQESADKTILVNILSKSSSVWKNTCVFSKNESLNYYKVIANISTAYPLSSTGLLASTGYIDVQSSLTAETKLIILAAGDVILKNLISPNPIDITIISTSGLINIDTITGSPKLKLISKYGYFINGIIQKTQQTLMPELKSLQVISLSNEY